MKHRPSIARLLISAGAICFSLTACATPRERIVYRDVPTPIPVPCATEAPPEQQYAADTVSLDADLFELVRALLVDREERKAAELKLRAAVEACG